MPDRTAREGANASRRPLRASLVVGAVVGVLVLGGGIAFVTTQSQTWTASASIVVLPDTDLDPIAKANAYETLSRGQVVATFAEVLRLQRFEQAAVEALGLPPVQAAEVETGAQVVTDTSMIVASATAPDAEQAEAVVNAMVTDWESFLNGLDSPYEPTIVSDGAGTATSDTASPAVFFAVLAFVALVAAFAAQQVVLQLTSLLPGRARRTEVASTGEGAPADGSPRTSAPRTPVR